jgi:hypothetical protein
MNTWKSSWTLMAAVIASAVTIGRVPIASAQFDFEKAPVSYSATEAHDRIAHLAHALAKGETSLKWDEEMGWLPDLLEQLKVSPESQTLVFSKTSLQIRHISPTNPRALYFSDDTYIGWVPGGDLIELSAVDPKIGPVFYSLEQHKLERPKIERDETRCMTCHATSKTQDVPGYLVRSVFPGADGHPLFGLGTVTTDHTSPFSERFGGWYVTGTHGEMRHRGNSIALKTGDPPLDAELGANRTAIPEMVRPDRYLRKSSDLVALMMLEHQTQMHNFMTRANYETRQALDYQKTMNEALGRPGDYLSESTQRRIARAADELLKCLLFVDEQPLTSPIYGTSDYIQEFRKLGPQDAQGRSLREFDLRSRLLRYPCSPLIYSEAFDALPAEVLAIVRDRLNQILANRESSTDYSHLSTEDRAALREILIATKPGFLPVAQ